MNISESDLARYITAGNNTSRVETIQNMAHTEWQSVVGLRLMDWSDWDDPIYKLVHKTQIDLYYANTLNRWAPC